MRRVSKLALAGVGAAAVVGRAVRSPQLRLARMGGTTIAAPSAAGWVTDFLNAAYFRRPRDRRHVDALRLAFEILTTRWHLEGRRLTVRDVAAFHRAYGAMRLLGSEGAPRGTLDYDQLLDGAATMLGGWFVTNRDNPATRGWGIVFRDADAKAAYRPEQRLAEGRLGPLSPPRAPDERQTWHTYPPVPVGEDVDAVLELLTTPERWPDFGTELGHFTPVRGGGLADQTFEIEVLGEPLGPAPLLLRAYVTVTALHTWRERDALQDYIGQLADGLARHGEHESPPLPDDATPVAAVELTTHDGHFMGDARNRLLLFRREGGTAWLRAVGTWDPFDWQREVLYRRMGRHNQHAFWGMGEPEESLLHQIAEVVAGRQRPPSPLAHAARAAADEADASTPGEVGG